MRSFRFSSRGTCHNLRADDSGHCGFGEGHDRSSSAIPIIPTITPAGGSATYGTTFDSRLNQLDLRLSRTFRIGSVRLQGMADLYNSLNARPSQQNNITYGAAGLRPTAILGGRLFKIELQVNY